MNKDLNEYSFYTALDMKVIAVVVANLAVGDWTAYIGAVPGEHHNLEWESVKHHGEKLPQHVAEAIFKGYLEGLNIYREGKGLEPLQWRN